MERTSVDEIEDFWSPASVRRRIGDAVEAEGFTLTYYEIEPGESPSEVLHTHLDQEELFYVVSGTLTFRTDNGQEAIDDGEAIRFAPGEYQVCHNRGTESVIALAVGAPKESTEAMCECPECGARVSPTVERGDDVRTFSCSACGAEWLRQTR